MDYTGAGLAALGVIGPGIGIGILGGLAASAIGRNPDAAGQIRGIAIILAAFAEGLGVLTLVFITLAIESHDHEEGHVAEEAIDAIEGQEPALQPAH